MLCVRYTQPLSHRSRSGLIEVQSKSIYLSGKYIALLGIRLHRVVCRLDPERLQWKMALNFLRVLLSVFGIQTCGSWIHIFIRLAFVVNFSAFCFSYLSFVIRSTGTPWILRAYVLTFIYNAVNAMMCYCWSCRFVNTPQMRTTRTMNLIVPLLIISKLITTVLVVDYVAHKTLRDVIGEVGLFIVNIKNHVVYMTVLGSLFSTAEFIDELTEKVIERDATSLSRRVSRHCAVLEKELSFPLAIFHVDYFVIIQSQVPIELPRLGCSGSGSYYVYSAIESFVIFFLLAFAGEAVAASCQRFRRKVRRYKAYIHTSLTDVQIFARQVQGVTLAFKTHLGLGAFCRFMGLTHGLSMMIYQIALVHANCDTSGEIP